MHKEEAGFTIIEVMVAIGVLLVGVLGTVTMLSTASATTERTQARVAATALARQVLETTRTLRYDDVAPAKTLAGVDDPTLVTSLQATRPTSDPDWDDTVPGGTWQVVRRGVTYTIDVTACVVDDPKDGLATSHSATGFYCPNLSNGTGDDNADDYRRVTAVVTWSRSGRTLTVRQTALIANPSGVLGPSVDFQGTVPNPPQNACPGVLTYSTIVTPSTATQVKWSVNDPAGSNGTATDVTPSPNTTPSKIWRVDWNLAAVYNAAANRASNQDGDATYTITVIAYSPLPSGGGGLIGGQPTFITQPINCSPPNPPTNLEGGYNWRRCATAAGVPRYPELCNAGERVIDFQWKQSPDADVTGYRIFRVAGAGPDYSTGETNDILVCPAVASSTPLSDPATILGSNQYLERGIATCKQDDPPSTGTTLTAAVYATLPNVAASLTAVADSANYYAQAVDPDPNDPTAVAPRPNLGSQSDSAILSVTEQELNMAPVIVGGISATTANSSPCIRWGNATDVDFRNVPILTSPIRFYRIYRDGALLYTDRVARQTGGASPGCPGVAGQPNTYLDTAVTSGSHTYTVVAVDQDFLESFVTPLSTVNWP